MRFPLYLFFVCHSLTPVITFPINRLVMNIALWKATKKPHPLNAGKNVEVL